MQHIEMKKRLVLGFASAVGLFILVISSNNDILHRVTTPLLGSPQEEDISCYRNISTVDGIEEFDSSPDSDKVVPGNNIFFHETSCFGRDGAVLTARQACAVESAAKMNPKMTIFLLYVSPVKFSNASLNIARQLTSYKNVKIRHIKLQKYTRRTPLEDWFATDILKKSYWPRSHMSDILRYLTLWKYGGMYLDLDVVVTSSLKGLTNFAGAEDWEDIAAGILGFGATGLGRKVANAALRDLKKNFRGDVWGHNGPGVITRVLQKLCSTKYAQDMTKKRCHGFEVHPPSTFYPIHYKKWKFYFDEHNADATMKLLDKALAIHVWNKLSKGEDVTVGSQAPYAQIAQKYCPKEVMRRRQYLLIIAPDMVLVPLVSYQRYNGDLPRLIFVRFNREGYPISPETKVRMTKLLARGQ